MLATVITFISFFTILTNLLVALVFTAVARQRCGGDVLRSPSMQAGDGWCTLPLWASSTRLLLRQLWNPQGAQWVADVLLHDVIPVGYVAVLAALCSAEGLRWKDAVDWLVYPGRLPGVHPGAGRGEPGFIPIRLLT